jgi:glycosyltransferase involved in cell wall biosynthesis
MLFDGRPPKILILGEARVVHTQRWAEYFDRRGWTVRWYSFGPIPDDLPAQLISSIPGPRAVVIPLSVVRLRRLCAEFQPDIVSALFLPDYGWLASMVGRHPLAVSAWGSDLLIAPNKSLLHRQRIRYVLGKADHLFADAEILRRKMHQLGTPDTKITIVPLGIEESWLDVGRERETLSGGPLTVGSTRRLEPLYRVETLTGAAARLIRDHPGRFRFVIIGDGGEYERLRKRARDLQLGDALRFQQWLPVEKLREAHAQIDLYVSTSSSDGTSVSLLEAMAAGCFPIVTNLPANREWITDGENGLLFPVDDAGALARAIISAADDVGLRTKAAARNQEIIASRALWQNNMQVVEEQMLDMMRQGEQ